MAGMWKATGAYDPPGNYYTTVSIRGDYVDLLNRFDPDDKNLTPGWVRILLNAKDVEELADELKRLVTELRAQAEEKAASKVEKQLTGDDRLRKAMRALLDNEAVMTKEKRSVTVVLTDSEYEELQAALKVAIEAHG